MKLIILQIENIAECEYAFRSYNKDLIKLEDYKVVLCSNFELNSQYDDIDILEQVFRDFNRVSASDCERLKNFKGHSLSVSDIVVLDDREYYCDSFGWKRIYL